MAALDVDVLAQENPDLRIEEPDVQIIPLDVASPNPARRRRSRRRRVRQAPCSGSTASTIRRRRPMRGNAQVDDAAKAVRWRPSVH